MRLHLPWLPLVVFLLTFSTYSEAQRQSRTVEDTLNTSAANIDATAIGGYGRAFYQHDRNAGTATTNPERMVLFIGHTFGSISFFSELEVEDAKVIIIETSSAALQQNH